MASYVVESCSVFLDNSVMKILIVSLYYFPEDFPINHVAENLVKRGHSVTVLTGKPSYGRGYIYPGYQNLSYELVNGVRVYRVNTRASKHSKLSIFRNAEMFVKNANRWVKATKEKYDVVYTYGKGYSSVYEPGNLYKKIHHVPHIGHVIDLSPEDQIASRLFFRYSPYSLINYLYSRHEYKKLDQVVFSSPSYKEYFDNVLLLKKVNSSYIPQPIYINEKSDDPYHYDDGFNILYKGEMNRIYQVDIIIEAMRKVGNEKVNFHIFGYGKYASELVQRADELGLGRRIIFHGDKPNKNMVNYYVNCDMVFVGYSRRYHYHFSTPDSFIEAMAYEKPILAVMDGDSKNILQKCDGGVIAKENIDDLVYAISKAASLKKTQLEKMGHNNYEYYNKYFNLNYVVTQIESVLLEKSLQKLI